MVTISLQQEPSPSLLGAGCPHRQPGAPCPEPVWLDVVGQQHGTAVESNLSFISTASPGRASPSQRWGRRSRGLSAPRAGSCLAESSGWRWQDTSSPSTGLVEAPQVRWGHEEVKTGRAGQPDGGERRPASSITTLPSQGAFLVPAPSADQGMSLFSPWQACRAP